MGSYTVKAAMTTGKTSPTFGSEYYIQFDESDNSFPMWFKKQPTVGQRIEGDIVGGKFKKEKKEWNPNDEAASPTQAAKSSPSGRSFKDNSDGMRQGMCINNAANYVNTLGFEKALTDTEWASIVHSYATALYKLGDLSVAPSENVSDLFNDN